MRFGEAHHETPQRVNLDLRRRLVRRLGKNGPRELTEAGRQHAAGMVERVEAAIEHLA